MVAERTKAGRGEESNLMVCYSLWGLRKQSLELKELSGSEIGLHFLHTEHAVLA